jgi:hypothetical protein
VQEYFRDEGAKIFRHTCALGSEGIVSKRLGSLYRSGRSNNWVKVKNPGSVKSHPTPTPRLARKNAPSDVAETGGAEPQIAEQSRSWRAAIGEREVMRGS